MASHSKKISATKSIMAAPMEWLWAAALVAAVIVAYIPVWSAGFAWDDRIVFTSNPVIVGPLGLKEIWTTSAADICPLTLTTFWLEHQIWGAAPLPYHLVNVFLHGACAVMLWRVLRLLLVPGAWLGAALWALHPLQVESVAWISEMKNTQSGLFFLCSIFFFLRAVKGERPVVFYGLTLFFAALAMASKSSTVVLPAVLLLCAWWSQGGVKWPILFKVLPIFGMSLLASIVTFWTQNRQVATFADIPDTRNGPERLLTAADGILFYLGKVVWPRELMPIYPHWSINAANAVSYLPLLVLIIALSFLAFQRAFWSRAILFALGYFIVALLPTLGIVSNAFSQFSYVSDHFQYLASMGPFALVAAGFTWLGAKLSVGARARPILAGVLLFVLGSLTCAQANVYQDDLTLWAYNVEHNPNCWVGCNNLGVDLYNEGRLDDSVAEYRAAIKVRPDYALALNNLACILRKQNQPAEAEVDYQKSILCDPRNPVARKNFGDLLLNEHKLDAAQEQYEEAIALDPNNAEYHNDLGVVLAQKGDLNGSLTEVETAIRLQPDLPGGQTNLDILHQALARKAAGK